MKGFRYGFGFVPNFKNLLLGGGGGSPVFPTAGNVGYYSAEDISKLGFSSANNVNFMDDISSAGNDLSQVTASANMTFIEHDTATQFTLANQPTLIDTGGGELAVSFDISTYMRNIPAITGDVSFIFRGVNNTKLASSQTLLAGGTLNTDPRLYMFGSDAIYFFYNTLNIGWTGLPTLQGDIAITVTGNTAELYLNGTSQGTKDISSILDRNYTFLSQPNFSDWGSIEGLEIYSTAVSDVVNPTETPDFELIPSEANCNTTIGQPISRWNATSHKPWLNRLLSDGNDDHLEGMAVQTGDFTYMFKLAFNALSTTEYIFSHTTGLSAVVLLSDNYIYLRDTTGANDIGLIGHTVELGEHVYTITREGNSLKYYVDSCLKDTIDVTGRTFELDTFGRPTDSLADLTADWGVWNRALTKEELDYFSYLRSAETNEILLPPLTPDCPI